MNRMIALQDKRLLRVDEAAKILNVSRWTVYRWVEAGQLGGTRLGAGSLRIFSDTVTALIDHHCVGASIAAGAAQEGRARKETSGPNGRKNSISGVIGSRRQASL